MGMNYYVVENRPSIRSAIHIGKSSMGWLFHFQEQNITWLTPEIVWYTYPQVKAWLQKHVVENKEYVILNEENELVTYDELIDLIDSKQKDPKCKSNPDNFSYAKNIDGYRFSSTDFS